MPFCGNCGAPVNENEQCSQCGAVDVGEPLEVDHDTARATKPAGVTTHRPTGAQLGAEGGAAEMMSADDDQPWGELAPVPRRPPPSFDEREHSTRLMVWRLTRVPVLLILGWFTISHLFLGSTWVFIDNVNLLIHEGGHVAFSWAGQTLYVLGGTLGQLMMPAAFALYFLWWRRERFAGVACVWWFGENFVPISIYMKDAPTQELPLLGGGKHDWAFLMGRWGLMHRAQDIAEYFYWLGLAIMVGSLLALIWWTMAPTSRELVPPVE